MPKHWDEIDHGRVHAFNRNDGRPMRRAIFTGGYRDGRCEAIVLDTGEDAPGMFVRGVRFLERGETPSEQDTVLGYLSEIAPPVHRPYATSTSMTPEEIARVAYGTIRTQVRTVLNRKMPKWGQLPAWQAGNVLNGVRFQLASPGASEKAAHAEWCRYMRELGWEHGPQLDEKALQHPQLVAWEDLPPGDQRRFRLFRAVVLACVAEEPFLA